MYIADTGNNRIRKVTVSTGIITTIVGTGTGSYSGDNGAATSATIKQPRGVAVYSSGFHFLLKIYSCHSLLSLILFSLSFSSLPTGDVYIVDSDNNRIRKVTASTSAPR